MKERLIQIAQSISNKYLNADLEVASRLHPYAGKSILVELVDLGWCFSILIESKKMVFSAVIPEKYTTKIKGRSFSLLRLLLNKGPVNSLLKEGEIEIEGDVLFLQALQTILSAIEVDLEIQLAPYIGDFAARHLGVIAKKIKTLSQKNRQLLQKNITLYLQEELKLFPAPEEVRDWYDDVACLRDDVERMEVKIACLTSREVH